MKLLVRNLPRTMTEYELREMFKAHGSLGYCTLVLDEATGESKGFAFIDMPNDEEALAAIEAENGKKFDKDKIRVKAAE
ncbi:MULTISPECIES: RNA-binding protein [unclassified Aliivibrio]|jgi:RNA recognition motif-containing protein|uniref:RNA recognition motif domain-containing protein n=1 Tax=unclassified Aliivibrio TaxID=2645654 RepID=UPI00080ECF61|nr:MULTISPECIES: RNA-binding protein [unclassified Aliivibrio]OCH14727.1 RNA recognition motif containing protein [Aliivibrio sp. 1S165]OCH25947.1 RNA recognition motif containing protein [Aliivibrio sp. 1S128]OCH34873.1 RNA recognition motif containing protein [Aliivibrio sp. 1S175]